MAAAGCAEDLPIARGLAALKASAAKTGWGPGDNLDRAQACTSWRVDAIPADLRQPVRSNVKMLLLNGDLDLDTFPEWGAHAAQTLPNAANVVVPYATHSTMSIPCVQSIIATYLAADGNMSKVDLSCIKELKRPAW